MLEKRMKMMIQFKTKIAEEISNVTNINKEELEGYIEMPKDSKNGDYAFPCFRLAKELKKAPPMIANEIKEKIKIDEELINRTKELQTDTITIQTEDTIVNTRSIESLKHIVETNDDIGEREIAFTINFNNGTILQIYGPIEFNEEGIIELKGKRYGTIITSENLVKKVQVPRRVIYEIAD